MSFAGKLALVTGAASGIGQATAVALAREGADLVICDVNAGGLEETAAAIRGLGRQVLVRTVDVARREAMEAFAAEVHAAHPAVDILVNNAGVGLGGGLLDTTLADWDWIVGINVMGVVHGCHFFVPPMVRRARGGHVVNVSSGAAFAAPSSLVAYAATKFAVFGLSEALRDELVPHGIPVTTVCPGVINTPITRSSPMRGAFATPEVRAALVAAYQRRGYGPERVAQGILTAIRKKRAVAPISPEAWLIYYLKRLAPSLAARLNRMTWKRFERSLTRPGSGRPLG